jgi:hypothetical protein
MLCVCDSEEREHGSGVGVNATMLLETLRSYDSQDLPIGRFGSGKKPSTCVDAIVRSVSMGSVPE